MAVTLNRNEERAAGDSKTERSGQQGLRGEPMAKKAQFCYDFPRPSVTVDIAIVTRQKRPRIVLIRRKKEPFAGAWALPGGFIEMDETLEESARRELREETGVAAAHLVQLGTYGDPGRDPRGRTITVAYLARVNARQVKPVAADDAAEVNWFAVDAPPALAFDHDRILARVREHL
jgi:8-oxo-dGTP diphosphatase